LSGAVDGIDSITDEGRDRSARPRRHRVEGPPLLSGERDLRPDHDVSLHHLAELLRSRWPGVWTSISRDCTVGGRSEHKDGRGIDAGGVSAFTSTRARAESILNWLLATDADGHRFANARRLGVMYLIWDKQLWVASEADRGWQPYPCSGVTLCHQDHIHMSISQAGAAKQTSYWTGRTGYPPGLPVAWLDTRAGSLTLPTPLEPGRQYRLTAHGAFITGPAGAGAKPLADANCSTPSAYGWRAGGIRLTVDGSTAWTPALSSIPGCDLRTHTYSMMLTPSRAYRPVIRIVGDGDLSNNSNRVRITVTTVS
jgi:hypothetical protein